MKRKYILFLIILILCIFAGTYIYKGNSNVSKDDKSEIVKVTELETYKSDRLGLSLTFPEEWILNETENCHEYASGNHYCLNLTLSNDYELRIISQENYIHTEKILFKDEYDKSVKLNINNDVTILRPSFINGVKDIDSKLIIALSQLNSVKQNENNTGASIVEFGRNSQIIKIEGREYVLMYLINKKLINNPGDLNPLDKLNEMDGIVESIEFID